MNEKIEATNALMATLGEYDVLWDGTLLPEIIDAEFYDCPGSSSPWNSSLPINLCLGEDRELMNDLDRIEALEALLEVIKCYVGTCIDAPLFSEEVDGELYDCSIEHWPIDSPQDWPSVKSLK